MYVILFLELGDITVTIILINQQSNYNRASDVSIYVSRVLDRQILNG